RPPSPPSPLSSGRTASQSSLTSEQRPLLRGEGGLGGSATAAERKIWLCGEVVTTALMKRIRDMIPGAQILNLYSVSETHDVACSDLTSIVLDPKRSFCPVGRPLPGIEPFILDDNLNVQPVGVPGEAVEREILDLPEVQNTCVLVQGNEGEDKFLVAYVVTTHSVSQRHLRSALMNRIPFYMVPSVFVMMESLPTLPASGKLDKKALPKVDISTVVLDIEALPSTSTEKEIAKLWCHVLRVSAVDVQESFFDLGGHSLLATRLLSLMNDKFQVQLTVRDLFAKPTVQQLAAFIDQQNNHKNGIASEPSPDMAMVDLMEEVDKYSAGLQNITNLDMQLRAFWRAVELNSNRWYRGSCLLTGATGFLGSFLLKELMLKTKATVYCLLRELPGVSAKERLQKALKQFRIIGQGTASERLEERLGYRCICISGDVSLLRLGLNEEDYGSLSTDIDFVIHAGDVSLLRLGLNEEDYGSLSTDIDFVIHAAATVNLVYPYHALRGANVVGTANIIQFACNGRIKPIHYISTDAVFPLGVRLAEEESDMNDYAAKLEDGYSQSKWVAEQLIRRIQAKGVPATVYRCGNLAGTAENTAWNPHDFTLIFIKGCIGIGAVPDVDWQMELTPVDFVSEIVVHLTQNLLLGLGKVYHLMNSSRLDARILWSWMKGRGYPLKVLSFSEWKQHLHLEATSGTCNKNESKPNLRLFDDLVQHWIQTESFFSNIGTFRQSNLQDVLQSTKKTYPETNIELFTTYFKNLKATGDLPKPPHRRLPGPLQDKVAVITGASSGIGRAIAVSLVKQGAKVVLGARRIDRLIELRNFIESEYNGYAVACEMDVTNRAQVKKVIEDAELIFGPIDILVNNAGCGFYDRMQNQRVDQWMQQVDVNIKGVLNCLGEVLTSMVERRQGHIINMSSDAGKKALSEFAIDSSKIRFMDAEDVAEVVTFALCQPDHVAINEILVEPKEAAY
ncbi:unnamed protein product, partial [Cyprideis torosa]